MLQSLMSGIESKQESSIPLIIIDQDGSAPQSLALQPPKMPEQEQQNNDSIVEIPPPGGSSEGPSVQSTEKKKDKSISNQQSKKVGMDRRRVAREKKVNIWPTFQERFRRRRSKDGEIAQEEIDDYISDKVVALDNIRDRSTIRIGDNYQAEIPSLKQKQVVKAVFSNTLVWNRDWGFNQRMLELFRQQFGPNRNQEELCEQFYNSGGNWQKLPQFFQRHKKHLKKLFNQRDRAIQQRNSMI